MRVHSAAEEKHWLATRKLTLIVTQIYPSVPLSVCLSATASVCGSSL